MQIIFILILLWILDALGLDVGDWFDLGDLFN